MQHRRTKSLEEVVEDDDWGHFSSADEEPLEEEEEEEEKHEESGSNRFSSSRYGTCAACAVRYPRGGSCGALTKGACSEEAPLEKELRLPTGDAVFSSETRLNEIPQTKRRRDEELRPIEARVRKRRDDFCSETRGNKTARWDVERWHVFAPRVLRRGEYVPDRDGIVLSPAFRPRVATRFFATRRGVTVSFSMGSIRVVSTNFERFAQYELVVNIDGRAGSTWRRYSAFRALVASVAAESPPRNIVRTLSAWADAQDAKRIFRCTHPAYLIQRYYHFEHVLREALFELPNPALLLSFFEPEDNKPLRPPSADLHAPPHKKTDAAAIQPRTFLANFLGPTTRPPNFGGPQGVRCH